MKHLAILLCGVLALSACDNRHHGHRPNKREYAQKHAHRPVQHYTPMSNGSYAYYDPNVEMWYYLWLFSDSNRVQYVERSTYAPADRGLTISASQPVLERDGSKQLNENEQLEPEGQIEAEDVQADAQVDAENATIDSEYEAAVESFENEGGNLGPDSDSSSDSSSSDSGSSDSGSSDSGGGDSGGGGE